MVVFQFYNEEEKNEEEEANFLELELNTAELLPRKTLVGWRVQLTN